MADEQYHNFPAQSSLTSGINNTDVSATVADGSVFSSTGDFQVVIENEIVKVTARSSNTLTIVRGQEGTTAASHGSGTTVTQVLTRDGLLRVGSRVNVSDTYANRPAAGTRGRLFLPTDGYQIEREDSSTWSPWGPLSPFTPPIDANYAWVNQGSASVETTFGGIYLTAPAVSGNNLRIRKKSAPSTPYTITAAFVPSMPPQVGVFPGMGLCFRESGTSKIITASWNHQNDPNTKPIVRASFQKWTNETTFSNNYPAAAVEDMIQFVTGPLVWQQIGNDGTNLTFSISNDGQHFFQIFNKAKADFFTTAPNEVGFWANSSNTSFGMGLLLLHWKEA